MSGGVPCKDDDAADVAVLHQQKKEYEINQRAPMRA